MNYTKAQNQNILSAQILTQIFIKKKSLHHAGKYNG